MTTGQYLKLGQQTALLSFLLGTGIFVWYFLTSTIEIVLIGYGFTLFAGLVNFGILISMAVKVNEDANNRKKFLITRTLMLLNIPVMLVYCWIAIILVNMMRINFTNSTQETLTNIKLVGCETKQIDKLEKGQSKTVWVGIPGDCGITIQYALNGKPKEERVVRYVTSNMGQKMDYNIGGRNKELFW